jgi:hypothetical protein
MRLITAPAVNASSNDYTSPALASSLEKWGRDVESVEDENENEPSEENDDK